MSRHAFARLTEDAYEIQRLRLLVRALEQRKKSRAVLVEVSAAAKGFTLIVTAPADVQEQDLAHAIADRIIELAEGALAFSRAQQDAREAAEPPSSSEPQP